MVLLALALCMVASITAAAPGPVARSGQAVPPDQPTPPPRQIEPRDLEAFFDGAFTTQLGAYHVPGVTVSLVRDGQVIFARGYGYADVDRRVPVSADETLFRAGSVSKLFVATAVMQLVEQGKLDLHADVNSYLDEFKIPATFSEPVTVANLMTHTGGFEDSYDGIFVADASDLRPLGPYLAETMPARVRPPGELAAYSNHGFALAAHVVERVSGMSFDQYADSRIFGPLGMTRSTFRQPLPSDLADGMATGYNYVDGAFRPGGFEYIQVAPAGSLSTTAADMAKFMIAHLEGGRSGEGQVLQPSMAQVMHSQHFTHDPRISGMAYGFYEMSLNGRRMIVHGGDTELFHTQMVLLPESRTGLFVSYSSPQGVQARTALLETFLDRYYPGPTLPASQPASPQELERYTGTYWPNRISYTGYLKLGALMNAPTVSATPDGYLSMPNSRGENKRWWEVSPGLFQETDGRQRVAFRTDAGGNATHLFMGNEAVVAFIRAPWYDTVPVQLGSLALCLLAFLSAVLIWPVSYLLHRWKGATGEPHRRLPHAAHWLAGGVALMNLAFAAGLVLLLSDFRRIVHGVSPALTALLAMALLAALLSAGVVALALLAWRDRYWGVAGRLHYTLVALAAAGFVLWLNHWNLLGFR
jgi:CubicO group peptidase (beta-lactamase class C family)